MSSLSRLPESATFPTRLHRALSPYRRWIALTIYAVIAGAAYLASYFLRFELSWPEGYGATVAYSLPILLFIRTLSTWVFRLALGRWRFVGVRDVARLAMATTAGSVVFFVAVQLIPFTPVVPRSVLALEWILTTYVTAGAWISYRLVYEFVRMPPPGRRSEEKTRALVVGAGDAGGSLVRDMLRTPTPYFPVGFVDGDPAKWGTRIQGVKVLGSIDDVKTIAEAHDVEELIIAIPSATPKQLREVVERCGATQLPHKVLPGIAVVLSGHVSVNQLRSVQIEDLLGREPIELALPELEREFAGTTVLVTGAAGSIGSELARQIAANGPRRLILLDQAESDLYFADLELSRGHPEVEIVPIVGDIMDWERLATLFEEYGPDFVFHAAAYKHVPLMEVNEREAVKNNVVGTWRVAKAAGASGARKFVFISTDKAVEPANVMGATKRVAELVTLSCQQHFPRTWFTAVRFGNVLGSQGSVIPLFKRQLEQGLPLTVTHADATRYFMTVSEAVQLVLQASVTPEAKGRIAMLEMGEPVCILDLASNLLLLSGAAGNAQHQIEFVGLRPGEKLHEKLRAPDETPVPTGVSKVRVLHTNGPVPNGSLLRRVQKWAAQIDEGRFDSEVVQELWELCGSRDHIRMTAES